MLSRSLKSILLLFVFFASFAGMANSQDFLPELVKRIKPSAVAIETFDAKDTTLSREADSLLLPTALSRTDT